MRKFVLIKYNTCVLFLFAKEFFQFSFICASLCDICIVDVRVYKGEVDDSQTFRVY